MKRTNLVPMLLLLTAMLLPAFTILPGGVRGSTLYVGGADPGNYTTIQAAIVDANIGDTIYVYNGTYYEQLTVAKTLTLIGEGPEMTVIDGNASGTVVRVTGDWVNITGFGIRNSGSSAEGLYINADNCLITDSNISDNNIGIGIWSSKATTITENIVFSNSLTGVSLRFSNGNTVANNTISWNADGLSLHSSENNIIDGNTVSWSAYEGIRLDSSNGNTISANSVFLNDRDGIFIYSNFNNISDNMLSSNGRHGISLFRSSSDILRNNVMDHDGLFILSYDFRHWNSHDIDASNIVNGKPIRYWKDRVGGTVPTGSGQVILANCSNVSVESQNISHTSAGIEVGFSSNTMVFNSTFSNNLYGIMFYESAGGAIHDNRAYENLWTGIRLESSYATVIENNAVSDNDDGISLWYSGNNNISSNSVSNNSHGIRFIVSGDNRVFHNAFIGNAEQAFENAGNNEWDNGYPSGGNYWSDYGGVDNKRGPDQDLPGSDGIGDAPYLIQNDGIDRYPLVSPGGVFPLPPRDVRATMSGSDLENVTVLWDPSLDEPTGLVGKYSIHRGENYKADGSLYQSLGDVPNGTHYFTDFLAGEGDPSNYFYVVCAVSVTNNSMCADNQAGKFTRPLSQGPNLVSIPLIQSNESVETVLQTVEHDKAWSYDSSSQDWKWHMTFKKYRRGLWTASHTIGLWINATIDCNLTVAGVVPTQTTIHMYDGWNLVSFPSFNASYSVSDLKAEIGATRVEGYDFAPPNFLRVMADADSLLAGRAYWVKVDIDLDWIVEAS